MRQRCESNAVVLRFAPPSQSLQDMTDQCRSDGLVLLGRPHRFFEPHAPPHRKLLAQAPGFSGKLLACCHSPAMMPIFPRVIFPIWLVRQCFFEGVAVKIRLEGFLTEQRLVEALDLMRAHAGAITCSVEGELTIVPTTAPRTPVEAAVNVREGKGVPAFTIPDARITESRAEEDDWDGPLPAYVSGVFDNSPEAHAHRLASQQREEQDRLAYTERRAREKSLLREHVRDKEFFGLLVQRDGPALIDALNTEIEAIWQQNQPTFLHDCKQGKAGQLRPMPQLELRGTTVTIYGFNMLGTTRKILTPLSQKGGTLGVEPLWSYPEWVSGTVPRLRAVIEGFALRAGLERYEANKPTPS